jgi:hypothetical protein
MGMGSKIIIDLAKEKINKPLLAKIAVVAGLIAFIREMMDVKEKAEEVEEAIEKVIAAKEAYDDMEEGIETMKTKKEEVEKTLAAAETAAKAATTMEKTSTIGSALNPAAAAVAVAQKFIIEKAKEEIADLKGAVKGIIPSTVDKAQKTVKDQKTKIDKFVREMKEKKRIAKLKMERNKV